MEFEYDEESPGIHHFPVKGCSGEDGECFCPFNTDLCLDEEVALTKMAAVKCYGRRTTRASWKFTMGDFTPEAKAFYMPGIKTQTLVREALSNSKRKRKKPGDLELVRDIDLMFGVKRAREFVPDPTRELQWFSDIFQGVSAATTGRVNSSFLDDVISLLTVRDLIKLAGVSRATRHVCQHEIRVRKDDLSWEFSCLGPRDMDWECKSKGLYCVVFDKRNYVHCNPILDCGIEDCPRRLLMNS